MQNLGPLHQRTEEQRSKGPKDYATRRPGDHRTRGPELPRSRERAFALAFHNSFIRALMLVEDSDAEEFLFDAYARCANA